MTGINGPTSCYLGWGNFMNYTGMLLTNFLQRILPSKPSFTLKLYRQKHAEILLMGGGGG